jgi:hypothetical protein
MDKLKDGTRGDKRENLAGHGIELPPGTKNADKLLRNCLSPEIGLAIFNQAWQVLTTGDYTLKMF